MYSYNCRRLEEESIQRRKADKKSSVNTEGTNDAQNNNNTSPSMPRTAIGQQSELKLHELRAEKYNGLVR